jgi:hypothetical protein
MPALRDELILLFPGIFIFSFVSSQTGFSEHMRYVLPAFPFFFIWISQSANCFRKDRAANDDVQPASTHANNRLRLAHFVVSSLFAWFVSSSLWIYPHSLSYFNELVGGPLYGPKHLLGSSVDWCQDLRYLKWWTEKHPEIDELHLAYYGLHDPGIANFKPVRIVPIERQDLAPPTGTGPGPPTERTARQVPLRPGMYAVSANVLYDQRSGRSTGGQSSRLDTAMMEALRQMQLYDRAGYSILIFRVE